MYVHCMRNSLPGGYRPHLYGGSKSGEGIQTCRARSKGRNTGAQGLENEITEEDLTRADAALIASDIRIKNVERFKDIPTMTVAVQEAVKDPDGIVSELMEALE